MIQISDKIAVRPLSKGDGKGLFKILDSERQSLRVWLPFVDYSLSENDTEGYVDSVLESENQQYILLYENETVGLIGFNHFDGANKRVEIGYWLSPKYEGKGIVTQAVECLLKIAFEDFEINRVQIKVAVDNQKSKKIPVRLGFQFEGIERDGELLVDNKFTDIAVYSLLKKEYKEQ